MSNLFSLQADLVTLINAAIGDRADVYTAYDLAKAKGRLSSKPAVYLLLKSVTTPDRTATEVLLNQKWEVSFSVPVSISDQAGDDAVNQIGELSFSVLEALLTARITGVKKIELSNSAINAGLVENRLIMPFTYNAVLVKRLGE